MKHIFIFISLILLCFANTLYGQNRIMDSLNLALKNAKNDTTRLNIYVGLCDACDINDNLKYSEPLIALADKLLSQTKDSLQKEKLYKFKAKGFDISRVYYIYKEGANSKKVVDYLEVVNKKSLLTGDLFNYTQSKVDIATYYSNQGNILKQLDCLKEGLAVVEQKKYNRGISRFYVQIEFLYTDQGDTVQAIYYLEKALELEKIINDTTRRPRGYFLTGKIYNGLRRYDKALEYFFKSIKKYEVLKNYNALGELYLNVGGCYLAKNDFDNALLFYSKSSDISKKDNNLWGVFLALVLKGDVYQKKGDLNKAIEIHKTAIDFCNNAEKKPEREDDLIMAFSISNFHLAEDFYYLKDIKIAKQYYDKAYVVFKKMEEPRNVMHLEEIGYKIDSASNDFKGAFIHYRLYLELKNKFDNEDVHKTAARDKFQNDLEKQNIENKAEQEKKDVLAKEDKQKQQLIIGTVAFVLLLVIIFSALLFKRFRLTNKQKGIIEQQKHLVEEKHKEITDSINYAERIQRSFLATDELLNEHLKNYFIFFKPKDIVSGDFYWADTLPNGNFILATADSTGHGVPGAIMSLLNITSLEKAVEHLTNPADILNHTRQTIINRLKRDGSIDGGKDGMDCSLIVFDFKNKQIHVAAANNPVWIIRQNALIELKADKMPVGKHDKDKESFSLNTFDIKEGDIVYTLTDGFPDQFGGPKGKKFMSKNLKELLLTNAHLTMLEQNNLVQTVFSNWIGEFEQVDDVTLIGIKI